MRGVSRDRAGKAFVLAVLCAILFVFGTTVQQTHFHPDGPSCRAVIKFLQHRQSSCPLHSRCSFNGTGLPRESLLLLPLEQTSA
jgi:hypothetical protein